MRCQTGGDELEAAERFAARRWRMVLGFTRAFACYGLSWILQLDDAAASRPTGGHFAGAGLAWATWGLAVLAATFGHGGPRWNARQRRVLNDELVAANRRTAAGVGYWLLLAGVAGLCAAAVAGAAPPGALLRVAAPVLVTVGIAGPAVVFSVLQLRTGPDAERHG